EALATMHRAHAVFVRLYGEEDLRSVFVDEKIGWLLTGLGRFDQAEEKLELSAARIRAAIGENTRLYASNLFNRGQLYRARGELERARLAWLEVARIHAGTYAPNPVAQGWTLREVAEVERVLGRPAQALETL